MIIFLRGLLGLETGHINIGMSAAVMDMQQFIYILGGFTSSIQTLRII